MPASVLTEGTFHRWLGIGLLPFVPVPCRAKFVRTAGRLHALTAAPRWARVGPRLRTRGRPRCADVPDGAGCDVSGADRSWRNFDFRGAIFSRRHNSGFKTPLFFNW